MIFQIIATNLKESLEVMVAYRYGCVGQVELGFDKINLGIQIAAVKSAYGGHQSLSMLWEWALCDAHGRLWVLEDLVQ
jgi:hypothetical protein